MEKLGIDIKLLVAQLVNFGLFFIVFQKFIAKPFLAFIKNEEKKDKEKARLTEEMSAQKEILQKEEVKAKEHLNVQIRTMMASAKKEAEAMKKDMIDKARKEAAGIVEQASRQMKEEQTQAEQSLKRKAADLSVLLVKQALKDYLNESAQADVTKHILSNLKN